MSKKIAVGMCLAASLTAPNAFPDDELQMFVGLNASPFFKAKLTCDEWKGSAVLVNRTLRALYKRYEYDQPQVEPWELFLLDYFRAVMKDVSRMNGGAFGYFIQFGAKSFITAETTREPDDWKQVHGQIETEIAFRTSELCK